MRILNLRPSFARDRQIYASEPHEDNAVRRALILFELAALSANDTLPLFGDTIDLAAGDTTLWAHRLPTAQLVITYTVTPEQIEIWTLRRDLRAG